MIKLFFFLFVAYYFIKFIRTWWRALNNFNKLFNKD
ncbi:hypothetical protein [Photobacterium phage PDCC-1]|uniref:Uncharacterized protein n=2 Tax=Aphroditevirus TaxID=2560092 RepID=A0A6B9J2A1_9CAUD|nr:hypothetical protein HWC03_gp055 [Vibrio phage 2 TSL-2019]YP_009853513.1 hypothetical protein HWC77_gp161 [Photobacterium phage PDCC-1]QAU04210.1 hypothetical protein [Vibrio phage 2 TSL-2019]QGZ14524.1 hypothetical protein [Photobacterium phage PDCC-1]